MNQEICVPEAALVVDGVAPETGDEVSMSVKGTVTKSESGKIYVTPTMVNDEEIKAEAKEKPADESPTKEADEMRAMAMKADAEMGY